MRLYLVQHGAAVGEEVDPQRPLSAQGREDIARLGEFLERSTVRVARVMHSGKLRARQTAEILLPRVCPGGTAERADHLNPNDPADAVARQARAWIDDVLLVGHLPHLARLVGLLILGDEQTTIAAFQPGSMVCLEKTGESWQIVWMLRPEIVG